MTPKEAVETIKVAIAEVEWSYPMDYTIAFEKAIEALEKQIPKKPIVGDVLYCQNCSAILIDDNNYCKNCGQKLKWGGDDAAD